MRIKKKRLSWIASSSPGVSGYRIYWSKVGRADYNSDHAELGKVTRVVIPDDIPSFPHTTGLIELGITAVSFEGNESDMVRASLQLKPEEVQEDVRLTRLRPGTEGWEPPLNAPILIDGLNYCVIENEHANGSPSTHTRYYYFESHYIEEWQWPVERRNFDRCAGTQNTHAREMTQ
jgi:hypothetical protein